MSEGQLIVGNYELRNCVATGNTTQIWEVNETGTPMQLAMKLLLEEARKNSVEKSVLRHEFKVGSSLDHPAFARFHQIEINRDHGFFVMDFVRSPSLKSHITGNLAGVQGSFRKLAESLCAGFQYMHEKGWLHRDIKPDNILVNKAGEAKIIDFSLSTRLRGGLGKILGSSQKSIQGTRTYIAPESILKKSIDQRTDVYSLGVTLYEVAAGQPPFVRMSPTELLKKHVSEEPPPASLGNPNVTPELDRVLLKMLAKKPKERFKDMQEVAAAFRGIKCFKEDPVELHERKMREAKEHEATSVDKRLDSRADAQRSALGMPTPAKPKKKVVVSPELLRAEEERRLKQAGTAPAAGPTAPAMTPMMAPMAYPGMPQYGMPQYGMPQLPMMMPCQYFPQMPGQPMMPMPGQYFPQMPGQPMMPMPGQPPESANSGIPAEPKQLDVPAPAPQIIHSDAPHPSAAKVSDIAEATEDDLQDLLDMIE